MRFLSSTVTAGLFASCLVACTGGSGLDLTIEFDDTVTNDVLGTIQELTFTAAGDESGVYSLPLHRAAFRTERTHYRALPTTHRMTLTITGSSRDDTILAEGQSAELDLAQMHAATITLSSTAALPDGGADLTNTDLTLADLASDGFSTIDGGPVDPCQDATQDGDEVGIDCGGSCPGLCIGQACTTAAACSTGTCDHVCVPASGPPSWGAGPSLSIARGEVQAAQRPDGTLVVVGGRSTTSPSSALATTEILTRVGFAVGPPLSNARYGQAVVADSAGNVYAIAGRDTTGADLQIVESLVGNGPWDTRQQTNGKHSDFAVAPIDSNRLLLADSGPGEVYDISANTWGPSVDVSPAREASGLIHLVDDKVYEIGGDSTGTSVANTDLFDGTMWASRGALAVKRRLHCAVLAPDGRIYAAGGIDTVALTSVEAYLPAIDRWTAQVAPLTMARYAVACGIGADGRIYVIGGLDGSANPQANTQAYGPVVQIAPISASAGTSIKVTVANLAANAVARVTLDTTTVAYGTSSGTGAMSTSFTVPTGTASGSHVITVIDARSQYPVTTLLTVP